MLTSGPQKNHTLLAVEFLYEAEFLMAALRSLRPRLSRLRERRRLRLSAPPSA